MAEDITAFGLAAWAAGTLPEKCVFLEVRYLPRWLDGDVEEVAVPLVLTAKQAEDLGRILLGMAAAAADRTDRFGPEH